MKLAENKKLSPFRVLLELNMNIVVDVSHRCCFSFGKYLCWLKDGIAGGKIAFLRAIVFYQPDQCGFFFYIV